MQYAYLKKYASVCLVGKPIVYWEARDYFGKLIAHERTKKECEAACRWKGYRPVDDR